MSWTPEFSYRDYYKEQLEDGLEYQDFVVKELSKVNLNLTVFSSRKYQLRHGESTGGVEIKHDKCFRKSRRLWIETDEKSNPELVKHYSPSGIYRENAIWYVIGDYETIFWFATSTLISLHRSGLYKLGESDTHSSKCFYLPVDDARILGAPYDVESESFLPSDPRGLKTDRAREIYRELTGKFRNLSLPLFDDGLDDD